MLNPMPDDWVRYRWLLTEFRHILQCPVTRGAIEIALTRTGVIDGCWGISADETRRIDFPIVLGQPVLVDFDSSVLDRSQVLAGRAQSTVRRSLDKRSFIKKIFLGTNPVAKKNANRFIALLREKCGERRPLVLVIGGGTIGDGAETLYASEDISLIAFDIYASPNTAFVADAHAIPFQNSSLDGVWIQAVLEHVLEPSKVVDEIHRVLSSGGLVYAETPFLQPVHEGAYDFTRFTESGHRFLFGKFDLISSDIVSGPGTVLYLAMRYCAAAMFRNRRLGTIAALPFFWLRYLDRFADSRHARDAASGVFFLGRRSDRRISPAEAISFYRGAG